MRKMTTSDFIEKSTLIHGNKYDYSKVNYIENKVPVIIIYNNIEYVQRPDSHLQGKCPEKKWKSNKGIDQFKIDANKKHNSKYDYNKSVYLTDRIMIIIRCKIHGEFNQTPNSHLRGNGCPKCIESKGECEIRQFLDSNNITYESQYRFINCKNKNTIPFDFYLSNYNICIEYDGQQHYEVNEFFGGQKGFDLLKENDQIKDEYCLSNKIKLLRIKYTDYSSIEKILYKFLNSYKKVSQKEKNAKFIEKCKIIWGYKYDYSKVKYIDAKTPVIIIYNNIEYRQTPTKHLNRKFCELNINALSQEEFVQRCKSIWNDRFIYDECIYINSYSKIKIFDTKIGDFIYQKAHSHMSGYEPKLTLNGFINLSNLLYDYTYDYTNTDLKNICDVVSITCPTHGEFFVRAYDHLNFRKGGTCKYCKTSLSFTKISKFLKLNNISFLEQYKFIDCRNLLELPFDFYIPAMRVCIDLSNNLTNMKLKINDKIKSDYCEDNYITLIRIRFDQIDKINEILTLNLIKPI